MFAARYYAERYFPLRYFPSAGADPEEVTVASWQILRLAHEARTLVLPSEDRTIRLPPETRDRRL
jgi:hypothetical protein